MARYETGFEDGRRLLRGKHERLAYGLLAVALVAAPWVLPAYHIGEATLLLIKCVASLGLMMLTGFTGQV